MGLFFTDLLLTIALEFPILVFGIRGVLWQRLLVFAVLINGLTFPLARLCIFELGWPLVGVEIGIFVVEAMVIAVAFRHVPWWKAVVVATVANAASWGLGTWMAGLGWI